MDSGKFKIVGRIDLDRYRNGIPHSHSARFRLMDAIVGDENGEYDLILFDKDKELDSCGISLIVGKNGVGKSYLFRAFVEFFVDFKWFSLSEPKRPYSNSRYKIISLRYILGPNEYEIIRIGHKFVAKINCVETSPNDIMIPNIVAAHFGLYDRFPIKKDRYDLNFYSYVGTKAAGNFISTNNIITHMLFSLCEDREVTVLKRIGKAFSKVGYDPKVTIKVKLKESEQITSFEKFKLYLEQHVESHSSFNASLFKRIRNFTLQQKKDLYNTYRVLRLHSEIVLDLNDYASFSKNRVYFSDAYLLKQLMLTSRMNYFFYRNSVGRDCNSLSSGEINMLATILSVASSIDGNPVLILLDEPELNQHPNWQMSIISQLFDIFGDFPCHMFIASHSHFLVSDLPDKKSVVIQMDYSEQGLIGRILPGNTYGWSAEQVLLEVFQTGTDRNMYLGNILGTLLDKIKNQELDISEVREQLDFLNHVSLNLKEIDPLKQIISSLNSAFKYPYD